jgi:hypothetical protein
MQERQIDNCSQNHSLAAVRRLVEGRGGGWEIGGGAVACPFCYSGGSRSVIPVPPVIHGTTRIKRKLRNIMKHTKISIEVPRYFWNKLSALQFQLLYSRVFIFVPITLLQ